MLFFEVGVEEHGDVANENAAEPGGADFGCVKDDEAVLAEGFELAQLGGEVSVEIDVEFAGDFVFDDYGMAEQAVDHGAAKSIVFGKMITAHGGNATLGNGAFP